MPTLSHPTGTVELSRVYLLVVKPGNFPGLTTRMRTRQQSLPGRSRGQPCAIQSVRGRSHTGTLHRLAQSDTLWVARPDTPASTSRRWLSFIQSVPDCASLSPSPVRGQPRTLCPQSAFTLGMVLDSYRSATVTGCYPERVVSGIARSTCCLRRAPGVLSYGQPWEFPKSVLKKADRPALRGGSVQRR